jgi:hypothetical protein
LIKITIQVIVDHRGVILDYELGWPGCVTDTTMFKQSKIWKDRHVYFEPGEYILVDKGMYFACSNHLLLIWFILRLCSH